VHITNPNSISILFLFLHNICIRVIQSPNTYKFIHAHTDQHSWSGPNGYHPELRLIHAHIRFTQPNLKRTLNPNKLNEMQNRQQERLLRFHPSIKPSLVHIPTARPGVNDHDSGAQRGTVV